MKFRTMLICIQVGLLMSCQQDNEPANFDDQLSYVIDGEAFCNNDLIQEHPGTVCCISGKFIVDKADAQTYTYTSNLEDVAITWTVVSGAMELVSGEDSLSVTVRFHDDFTEGQLRGFATSENICSESIFINAR